MKVVLTAPRPTSRMPSLPWCWRNLKRFHRELELYHSTMALFRNARPQEPLIVSITGVRLGYRIVGVIGSHPGPFLEMAAKVGITGGAYALATDAAAVSRVQAAAIEHGVLVDAGLLSLPLSLPDGVLRPGPRRRPRTTHRGGRRLGRRAPGPAARVAAGRTNHPGGARTDQRVRRAVRLHLESSRCPATAGPAARYRLHRGAAARLTRRRRVRGGGAADVARVAAPG